jgi:hypothetical protein
VAISKRLRYEVLRRDNFACYYCGAKPPGVELTADHVVPVALGGADEPSNLVAACGACNNGKTSSSPDAPLVAAVNEDAIRWSRALTEAAARIQAELAGHQEIYDQFDGWWTRWTYGGDKLPIPRPAGWESSIDSFLAAGLPLDMLEWCVRRAMASQAKPDGTWKYMCGVAWRKVSELQASARSLVAGTPTDSDDEEITPEELRGRASLACELLGDCDREELASLMKEACDNWSAETRDAKDTAAAQISWSQTRIDLAWLVFSLCDLLPILPGDVIEQAMRDARARLYDEVGPGFSRATFVTRVVDLAAVRYASPPACAKESAPF